MEQDKAVKRGRGVARREIIQAAGELFARNGYDGTGLRDVAALAGVDLALIYRSVGPKTELFRIAVLEPLSTFISEFVDRWAARGESMSNRDIVHDFVDELYTLLKEHREIVLALVSANAFSDEIDEAAGGSTLSSELDRLVDMAVRDADTRELQHLDLALSLRYLLGMVMSIVLLDDLVLPMGRRHPSRKRLIDTMTTFGLAGIQATTKPPQVVRRGKGS